MDEVASRATTSRRSAASGGVRAPWGGYGAGADGEEDGAETSSGAHGLRTWLALYKCLLGTAVLGMPHAVDEVGLILFPAVLLGFALCAYCGCRFILRSLDIVREPDADALMLGRLAAGKFGEFASLAVVALDSWGATVALIRTDADVLQQLLKEHSAFGPDSKWAGDGPVCTALAVAVFPLLLHRGTGNGMAWVNLLGIAALLGLVGALTVDLVQHGKSLDGEPLARMHWGTFVALPVIGFAFDGAQINQFPFHRDYPAQEPGVTKGSCLSRISLAACVSSAATYYAVAMIAYCVHLGATKSDVMDNLGNTQAVYVTIKVAFVVSMLLTVPVTVFESVSVVQERLFGPEAWVGVSLKIGLLVTAAGVAAFVPSMYSAFGYVGATTATLWIFVLPAGFFLGAVREHYPSGGGGDEECGDEGKQALIETAEPLPPPPPRVEVAAAWVMLVCGVLAVPFFVVVTAIG